MDHIKLDDKQYGKLMKLLSGGAPGRIERVFDWFDIILGKCTLILLWALEILGVLWIWQNNVRFEKALKMLETATNPAGVQHGIAMVQAVRTAATSMNGIVIAFCAGLPGFIGAIKAARKIWKEKNGNGDETPQEGQPSPQVTEGR